MAVVESIPNVSEGRRPDVIEACAASIRSAGAALLDTHSDPAHNRSVFTLAGEPTVVRNALLALVGTAVSRIDLRTHTGVHPRLGAVDVVPIVPIAGLDMPGCIALSKELAALVAAEHGIPVFLYEQSAAHSGRRRLEEIRRGQFEGLSKRMLDPAWQPDYGPTQPHPSAGAVVVGARWPLIAYNVNLNTTRLEVASRIAQKVRESSGGLPCVKALGLPLGDRGIVQVSMNLTNYKTTGIRVVFDAIKAEAKLAGVAILESEIVGLFPEAALDATSAAHVQLAKFDTRQVLEHRLSEHGLHA